MAPEVRLSGPNNEPLGIVSLQDALRMAGELDVDLVEIAATANPPVCRLMDYGKFKYAEQKKAQEILRLLRRRAGELDRPDVELEYYRRLLRQF